MSTETPQPAEVQPPVPPPASLTADVKKVIVHGKPVDAAVQRAKERAWFRGRAARKKVRLLASPEEFAKVTLETKAAVVLGLRRMNEIIINPKSGLDQVAKALMCVRQFVGVRALQNAELPDEHPDTPTKAAASDSFLGKLEGLKKNAVHGEA